MDRENRHSHSEAESGKPQAHAAKRSQDQISQRKAWALKEFSGKTVWDWLQLLSALAIPIVLAAAGLYIEGRLDERQRETENLRAQAERELAEQRAQDEALQAYLDQMSSLLLEKDLRDTVNDSEVRTLARARTLTALRRLDPSRKGELLQFLVEADLVQRVEGRAPIIPLRGANLSDANLSEANLSGADLSEADVSEADLSYADLSDANLSEANVSEANLIGSDLGEADLSDTDLSEADLSYANLSDTDLSGASGLTEKRLKQEANTITGASLPNEIFSDDFSNTSSGWPQDGAQKEGKYGYYVTEYSHGRYRINNPPPQSAVSAYSNGFEPQQDMIVEVDAQVSGDVPHGLDGWGVICRVQDLENFYLLEIEPGGYAEISKRENNEWQTLLRKESEYIHRGKEESHLRADCLGNKLTLFVNGHKVVEAKDSTIDSGVAGLHVQDHGDRGHEFEVLFDNFLVSKP